MKKTVLLLMILMVAVCALAACGPAEAAPAGETAAAAEEAAPAQGADEGGGQDGPASAVPEGTVVADFDEFKAAAADTSVRTIVIQGDVEINEDGYKCEPAADALIYIAEGASLTVSTTADINFCNLENHGTLAVNQTGDLLVMGAENKNGLLTNEGDIQVAGKIALPLTGLKNNGSVLVRGTGMMQAAQMTYDNYGDFTLESGGSLDLSKGCAFNNAGTLHNSGNVLVDDGGSLDNTKGTVLNEGTIDIHTYFNGDLNSITGGGKVNDYREAE